MTGTRLELPERMLNIICISLKFLHTSVWNPPIHVPQVTGFYRMGLIMEGELMDVLEVSYIHVICKLK